MAERITPSSGNVFADLGLPDADARLARADRAILNDWPYPAYAQTEAQPAVCWVPDCPNRATVEDWAGWRWCDDHKDSHAGEGGYTPLEGA